MEESPFLGVTAGAFALPFVNPGDQGVPAACGLSTSGATGFDVFNRGICGEWSATISAYHFKNLLTFRWSRFFR